MNLTKKFEILASLISFFFMSWIVQTTEDEEMVKMFDKDLSQNVIK